MRTAPLLITLLLVALYGAGCGEVTEEHIPPEGTVFPQDRVITGSGGNGYGGTPTNGTEPDIAPGMRVTLDGQSLAVGEANTSAVSSEMAGTTQVSGMLPDGTGTNHTLNLGFQTSTGEYGAVALESWLTPPPDFSQAGVQYIRADSGSGSGTGSTAASGTVQILDVAELRVIGTFNGQATVDGDSVSIEAEFNVARTVQP